MQSHFQHRTHFRREEGAAQWAATATREHPARTMRQLRPAPQSLGYRTRPQTFTLQTRDGPRQPARTTCETGLRYFTA
jgi:hypothetical protein